MSGQQLAPLDWEAWSVLVLFQVTDLLWVPLSLSVWITTCVYVLYKRQPAFFFLFKAEGSEKSQQENQEDTEDKEDEGGQGRRG